MFHLFNRTVSIECCYQNTGIAITSCLTIFSGDQQRLALGVPFFYTGMQTLIVGLFCLVSWKINWTNCKASENIFKMLLGNYQGQNSQFAKEGEAVQNGVENDGSENDAANKTKNDDDDDINGAFETNV